MLNKTNLNMALNLLKESGLKETLESLPQYKNFIKDISEVLQGTSSAANKTEKSVNDLVETYKPLLFKSFKHHRGSVYTLIDITNIGSTDQEKFPIMATYFEQSTQKKWSRPLVDFDLNFKLI